MVLMNNAKDNNRNGNHNNSKHNNYNNHNHAHNHTFDYDEWPSTNSDINKAMAPFNDSMFRLRSHY